MARLFITHRELSLFSDLTKEVIKDIVGQVIYYYSISYTKTHVHDVYEEAPDKVFEHPLKIDALVQWNPEDITTNAFGHDEIRRLEVYLHARDMLDRGIDATEGDFFSYGQRFYEITSITTDETMFGQVEHPIGYKMVGREARKSLFVSRVFGPTWEGFSDADADQAHFYQQRGLESNQEGLTGDTRDLQEQGVLESPLTGPKEISVSGSIRDGASFYDE